MTTGQYLFTSESVTMGHPDKVADQISDGVLDAILEQDSMGRVACETLLKNDLVVLAGEVTTTAQIDAVAVVREVIHDIGYTSSEWGIDPDSCAVLVSLSRQSPDIAMGVDEDAARGKELGAGDQGLMFGYATNETPELMPLPIALAHRIVNRLAELRRSGQVPWLRPDGKSQVTVEYEGRRPIRVQTVVISTQHSREVSQATIHEVVREQVIKAVIPESLLCGKAIYHINPTGQFITGGPHGDSGVTGRKIIVDTYGGSAPHGGGAFSGKDPTKVDRSATYMARYVAKNLVAAGLADECLVQLAYAIGVSEPVSVHVETRETAKVEETKLVELVREHFPLTPGRIIKHLDLRRPIYRKTAAGGHFGRSDLDFTWERTDKAAALRQAAGL